MIFQEVSSISSSTLQFPFLPQLTTPIISLYLFYHYIIPFPTLTSTPSQDFMLYSSHSFCLLLELLHGHCSFYVCHLLYCVGLLVCFQWVCNVLIFHQISLLKKSILFLFCLISELVYTVTSFKCQLDTT